MKLFAIRISKDWIEIRSSPKPIKGVKSTITKRLPVPITRPVREGWIVRPGDDAWYPEGVPYYIHKEVVVTRKITLSQTHWSGGRKLGVFQAAHLRGLCRVPPIGCAVTVPKSKVDTLLTTLRKREHKAPSQGNRAGDAQPFDL